MSINGKNLGVTVGVAVGSFVAGGLVARWLLSCTSPGKKDKNSDDSPSYKEKHKLIKNYVKENSLREPQILKELREYTHKNVECSGMISDPVQVQLFRLLLNTLDAKKCMEVGTYTGYNVLSCALTIPDDGVVYALDINNDYVRHGIPFFEKAKVSHKIKIEIAPATETMDMLIKNGHDETFDFIYVDANKLEYENYLERGLLLLRIGGILALDNTLQGGRVADLSQKMTPDKRNCAEYLRKLNQKIKSDNRFQLSFLYIGDGVTLCRKI